MVIARKHIRTCWLEELWDCYAVLVVGGNIIVQEYLNFGGVAMGQVNLKLASSGIVTQSWWLAGISLHNNI